MMLRFSDSDPHLPPPRGSHVDGRAGALQRTTGDGRLIVERGALGEHRVARLRQAGAAKILTPRNHMDCAFEAVLLNTAGGLAGGDRLHWHIEAGRGAVLRATSQTAERVYRSHDGNEARVETVLRADMGATLEWLPQETILFDGGRLSRTLAIDLAEDSGLLAAEAVVFGRRAFGERVRRGGLHDQWRVRRGGRLIFADAVRVEGDIAALLGRPAVAGGAQAFATIVLAARETMAIDAVRAMLPSCDGLEAGASALPHVTVVRLVAAHGDVLRPALAGLLQALRGAELPRVWQI